MLKYGVYTLLALSIAFRSAIFHRGLLFFLNEQEISFNARNDDRTPVVQKPSKGKRELSRQWIKRNDHLKEL
jgi:hypothetical protein